MAISLAKLLIEARWAKRVLFLCDRKELRKQAKNAFNDFVTEPIYVIGQPNDIGKLDARIYIGIYQGLINDYESFDVGFFDLIIADESHRSIYNLYGDLFKYFDALQIGLTATPVEMVNVFFYDVQSDGFTLDDKRIKVGDGKGDLPDVLAKYRQWCDGAGAFADRTAPAFEVAAEEIRGNGYDLSLSRYKKTRPVKIEHGKPRRSQFLTHLCSPEADPPRAQ